jgi:hypothetical protein
MNTFGVDLFLANFCVFYAFIFFFNTQTMHIKSNTHNSIAMFSPKTGSAVSEADAMSTSPRCQGKFAQRV